MKPKHSAIYWGVVNKTTNRIFPQSLHASRHPADRQRLQWNDSWRGNKFVVKRFLLVWKGTHYDIYAHEYKRIEK